MSSHSPFYYWPYFSYFFSVNQNSLLFFSSCLLSQRKEERERKNLKTKESYSFSLLPRGTYLISKNSFSSFLKTYHHPKRLFPILMKIPRTTTNLLIHVSLSQQRISSSRKKTFFQYGVYIQKDLSHFPKNLFSINMSDCLCLKNLVIIEKTYFNSFLQTVPDG